MFLFFLACGYDYVAQDVATEYLDSTDLVEVHQMDDWLYFEPRSDQLDIGFVFYPGGKVETEAYAPILHLLASEGIPAYAVHVPGGIAFWKPNAAKPILESEESKQWILGGHSLGGVVAAQFIDKHYEEYDIVGLSLWASYPSNARDLSERKELKVTSIVGDNDGVLNWENYDASADLLPETTKWISIAGGNHSQFGDYGFQEGDNEAGISAEEQWSQTVDSIRQMITQ